MLLTAGLIAAITLGGLFAYLTGEDSDVNVMTTGSVAIAQHEYERVCNADGTYAVTTSASGDGYELQTFTQNKPLFPAIGTDGSWDSKPVYLDQLGLQAKGEQAVYADLANAQDKFVLVENTGSADAYVRTIIAYEVGGKTDAFGRLIRTSSNPTWQIRDIGITEIQDNFYHVVEYTYLGSETHHPGGILPVGDYTENNLAQIYLASGATNEDVAEIDGNENGTYDILVLSQAAQAAGFSNPKTALDTAFGPVDLTKVPSWFEHVDIPGGKTDPVYISSYEEAYAAFSKPDVTGILTDDLLGEDTVEMRHVGTFDGSGYSIIAEAGDGNLPAFLTKGGIVEAFNLECEDGTRSGIGSTADAPIVADLYIDSVNITAGEINGEAAVYALHGVVKGNNRIDVVNSYLEGSIHISGEIANLSFQNCEFRKEDQTNEARHLLTLCSDTDFDNCSFFDELRKRIQIVPPENADGKKTITLRECSYNDEPITANNIWNTLLNHDEYEPDDYLQAFTIIVDNTAVTAPK